MGVAYSKDSAYAQEARKWEATHTEYGPPGRPYEYREYPKRLYKARDAQGREFESVEVTDAHEERNYLSRGFCAGQDKAIEALLGEQTSVAEAAANRAFHEQRMSDRARAEAQAADDATPHHLPEIPETPIRPKGRKPKESSDGA